MSKSILKEEASIPGSNVPMKPAKISDEVLQMFNSRIGDEYSAHFLYNAAANWCKNANYKKASAFFDGEAKAELEHAKKLQDFVTQWNCLPTIPQPETGKTFESLIDIINQAYKIEFDLYKAYESDSRKIMGKDLAIFDFLEEFRQIQTESVAEFSDLLNALELIDCNDKFQILYFEQTYF